MKPTRLIRTLLTLSVCAISLSFSTAVSAASWKPMCVNGGSGQGTPNGTWKALNSGAAGGMNWKPLGSCAAGYDFMVYAATDGMTHGYRSRYFNQYAPEGSIAPNNNFRGYEVAEIAQYGMAFEVMMVGVLPQNFFNQIIVNGQTFSTNNIGYFTDNYVDNGVRYTAWSWYSPDSGVRGGNAYPIIFK